MVAPSHHDAEDRELVLRVAQGDDDAFRELFQRYGPAAKALAQRIVRQSFMAEEISQEAFLGLWRSPSAYRAERGSVRGWLMSAVHHRAVDYVRREEAQRRRAKEEADPSEVGEDVGEVVVDAADLVEQRARVRAALAEIPEKQRRVLEMMYYESKTQAMIAAELGLPLGTVKSRTLLGMRRLRTMVVEVAG